MRSEDDVKSIGGSGVEASKCDVTYGSAGAAGRAGAGVESLVGAHIESREPSRSEPRVAHSMDFRAQSDSGRVGGPTSRSILLEVIAESAADAAAAERGGADRIELVADLHLGGTTPSEETIRDVVEAVGIPVYVMIRPRDGDAVYTEAELALMRESILMAKEAGADGLVLGASRADGFVDVEVLGSLVEVADLPVTFHRAFDAVPPDRMEAALAALARVPRVERVLTSAGFADAEAGRFALRRLAEWGWGPEQASEQSLGRSLTRFSELDRGTARAQGQPWVRITEHVAEPGRPIIMPGGGVTADNLARIVTDSGVQEVHVGRAARTPPGAARSRSGAARSRSGAAGPRSGESGPAAGASGSPAGASGSPAGASGLPAGASGLPPTDVRKSVGGPESVPRPSRDRKRQPVEVSQPLVSGRSPVLEAAVRHLKQILLDASAPQGRRYRPDSGG